MSDQEITVTVSVSRRVNLGNYESSDVFMAVGGLRVGATAEEIQAAIVTGELAFGIIAAQVRDEAGRLLAGMR